MENEERGESRGIIKNANRNMSKSKGWTLQSSLLKLWMEKTQVKQKLLAKKNLQ